MKFDNLISLFNDTHKDLQNRAAKSVDTALVVRNWLFGMYIVEFEQNGEDRAEYGKRLLKDISKELKTKIGRGFSVDNLELFRRFYLTYQSVLKLLEKSETVLRISDNSISETVSSIFSLDANRSKNNELKANMADTDNFIGFLSSFFKLGWSHYVSLIKLKNENEKRFYEIEATENGWGYRELERQINSALYERLALSRDKLGVKKLSTKGQVVETPSDIIKNPYILEFTGLEEMKSYNEHTLETALIDKIEHFLLELGKGFLFESRQKRFSFDNKHFYVDLVFYNRLLHSYVVVDLKIGALKHQDLGQMQMYVNYFDRFVKTEEENPTIGILLCLNKSDSLVELTLPKESNIYASKYQLYLPSKEELREQIEEAEKAIRKIK